MKNLKTLYNSDILDSSENLYLYFTLGENRYAVSLQQIVEVMKLPVLDYPQKLPNNFVGLLNYNNFTINILDLRFYLNIKITPYSVSSQIVVVKTDETIFGLIVDKVEDIISLEQSKIEYLTSGSGIIEFIYKKEDGTISVININGLENVIKQGVEPIDIDIPSLFPDDDDSKYKLMQRGQALQEKFSLAAVTNIFSQDRFISFSLNTDIYCMDLKYVKEFLKNFCITKIPCSLDYISGVIALRGEFITVVNLKKFLGISDESADSENSDGADAKNNIIILKIPDFEIGFLVDEILSIINIPEDLIKKSSQQDNKYILNDVVIDDKFYTVLDIKNILSDEKFFIEE